MSEMLVGNSGEYGGGGRFLPEICDRIISGVKEKNKQEVSESLCGVELNDYVRT